MKKIKELYKKIISWFSSDDEWHELYDRGSLNHGQGPMTRESGLKPVSEDDDTITQQYYTGL